MSQVFSKELVADVAKKMNVADLQNATIGDVLLVASDVQSSRLTGSVFVMMSPAEAARSLSLIFWHEAKTVVHNAAANAMLLYGLFIRLPV